MRVKKQHRSVRSLSVALRKQDIGERGFAIMTAIFVMVAMAILGVASVALISGSAQQMRDEYQSEQAFQVAMAGRAHVADVLKGQADWSTGNTNIQPITNMAFGPGTFSVTYLSQSAGSATAQITGTVGGITRRIQQDFTKGGTKAFQDAVYIGCANPGNPSSCPDFSKTGSGTVTITGDMAMGGDLTQTGSGTTTIDGNTLLGGGASVVGSGTTAIDGNATVGASSLGSGVTVTGTTTLSNPPDTNLAIPVPNWTYWQNLAQCVGQTGCTFTNVTGDKVFAAGTYTGNWYVTGNVSRTGSGDVKIIGTVMALGNVSSTGSGDLTIDGTLITQGTLSVTGSGKFINDTSYPAAPNPSIVAGSDVSLTGSGQITLNGWLYSQGSVSLTGSGSLDNKTGGITAGNGVSMTGSGQMNLTYDQSHAPTAGFTGGESSSGGEGLYIGMSNWKETF